MRFKGYYCSISDLYLTNSMDSSRGKSAVGSPTKCLPNTTSTS
jgi:hypothetical protein